MPAFFFNVTVGDRSQADRDGSEFATLAEARRAALATLGQIANDKLSEGIERDMVIEIQDEKRRRLITVSLLLRIEPS